MQLMKQIQEPVQSQKLILSQQHIQQLAIRWDARNADPLAYVPHEKRGIISVEDAILENKKLGEFASGYRKRLFAKASMPQKFVHWTEQKSFLFAGFGGGYDSGFVAEADKAKLRIVCLDVSPVACANAKINLEEQWEAITPSAFTQKPLVVQAEIRSTFLQPEHAAFDMSSVVVFDFCRTLTCLSKKSAKIVLGAIGRLFSESFDPNKEKRLIVISAMRDYNPTRVTKTSKMYYVQDLLAVLKKESGRTVDAVNESTHTYFDQVYTAMTMKCT